MGVDFSTSPVTDSLLLFFETKAKSVNTLKESQAHSLSLSPEENNNAAHKVVRTKEERWEGAHYLVHGRVRGRVPELPKPRSVL
nr:hypothetical protein Iba_scaffold21286CG0020 [Ipomoea batatas]